jgi:ABC-type bacteriocin/lantibiotic exporter with double-glycine peptidase domain
VSAHRRLLAPEVIQSSALDCGPAALKALAEGFGIPVAYGRLREACQTGVDGTSIDAVESVARMLGLDAEQVMLPADHLLLPEANALPAVVVIRNPGGMTHFVVAWRAAGGRVQVMDPATGRRFPSRRRFLSDLYIHAHAVPADAWKAWARSGEFTAALRARLVRLGAAEDADALIRDGAANPCWRGLATLDAAARLTASLVAADGVKRGPQAARALRALLDDALAAPAGSETEVLPPGSWMVRPHPPGEEGEERLLFRGAVLVRVRGRIAERASAESAQSSSDSSASSGSFASSGGPASTALVESTVSSESVPSSEAAVSTKSAVSSESVPSSEPAAWVESTGSVDAAVSTEAGVSVESADSEEAAVSVEAAVSTATIPELRAALEERSAAPGRRLWGMIVGGGDRPTAANRGGQGGVRPRERMNSPLERRKVRLRGLGGRAASGVPSDSASAARGSSDIVEQHRFSVSLAALLLALIAAAGGVVLEALLFRGLLDAGRVLGTAPARAGLAGALVLLAAVLLATDLSISHGLRRMGRHLEARLRVAFLRKLPRLGDRYFHSRLTSDMAERAHAVHTLRMLPELGGRVVRTAAELAAVTAAIAWIDPSSALPAMLGAAAAVAVPLAMHGFVAERDLRVRSHQGALGRFYLDSLLGLVPIRAHGAERSVRREHEMLVAEWARAGLGLFRALAAADALAGLAGYGAAAWIVLGHTARSGASGSLLLLAYWALALPALGQSLALAVRQYPVHRNVALRLFETLDAGEEEEVREFESSKVRAGGSEDDDRPVNSGDEARGVEIEMRGVRVEAAGTEILRGTDLRIEPGAHVAVVGPSGAGKSTLVGLLLGWHRPARGEVRVDGRPLDGTALRRLRARTAWVDPAVQLWNRSAAANLAYGAAPGPLARLGAAVDAAGLRRVVQRLPQGLQTPLGEGGALVSGGEGQRVRFGRAWLRRDARLVVLDEPFRGLDRERRHALLVEARRAWAGATLLCVTHDVVETAGFDRVLVVEDGAITEDGAPAELAARPGSRYARLLASESAVRARFDHAPGWRRIRLENGRLREHDALEMHEEPAAAEVREGGQCEVVAANSFALARAAEAA